MKVGDYLLIDGISHEITGIYGESVYLKSGSKITRQYAECLKCSSSQVQSALLHREGKEQGHTPTQLKLI